MTDTFSLMNLLEVRNLQITYKLRTSDVVAVDDVSFSIAAGECLGVVGESGCGKTTVGMAIMQLLAGNGHISAGEILLNGKNLVGLPDKELRKFRGRTVALIPQDPMTSLNPVMRIGDQVVEAYRIHHRVSKKVAAERALEMLRMVEIPNAEERFNQYPFELSGGLRQRVIIAMALVCEPQLLIADEPTTALDVTIQAQILDVLDNLREKYKLAVMLITHDMGVIASRTDRVVVMYAGRAAEEASTSEIFRDMRHPYTRALLASVPSIEGDQPTRLHSIPGLPPDLTKPIEGCRFRARCEFATEECRRAEPSLTASGDGHRFACFNPLSIGWDGVRESGAAIPIRRRGDEILVSLQNLTKDFPLRAKGIFTRERRVVSAVSDITLDVYRGETLGIVGESGSGKTTVGKLIMGLEKPTSGSISFTDADPSHAPVTQLALAKIRQMIFQDPYASLNPRKRIVDLIGEPLDIQGTLKGPEQTRRIGELLDEVGLPQESLYRYPHELSGGQRQRVGLARAMALQPAIIIADEPVSSLDVSIQAQMLNLLSDLRDEKGLSYLFISHDLAVVRYIADRIGVMYLGKLVEIGPAHQVFTQPAHHYTRALLDAVPVANPDAARGRSGSRLGGEIPSAIDPPSGCRFRTRCPAATEECTAVEPTYAEAGDNHLVACHHPLRATVAIRAKV